MNTVRLFLTTKMYAMQQDIKRFGRNLRFKRWSRANFAVFASISSCVSIGRLKVSITDCLLKKQENSLSESFTEFIYTEKNDSECSELAEPALLIGNQVLVLTGIKCVNSGHNYNSFYNITQTS